MARFLSDTILKILRGQFREGRQLYELHAAVHYHSDVLGGVVVVPQGYVTDLASVPKLPLTWLMAGGTGSEAAVIHDWLYTARAFDGKPIERSVADKVFREAIAASEDTKAPGWLMWLAVRVGGRGSWKGEGPTQPDHVSAALALEATPGP
jgi:hypothetical protein